jgi:hypothetical protein
MADTSGVYEEKIIRMIADLQQQTRARKLKWKKTPVKVSGQTLQGYEAQIGSNYLVLYQKSRQVVSDIKDIFVHGQRWVNDTYLRVLDENRETVTETPPYTATGLLWDIVTDQDLIPVVEVLESIIKKKE